MSGLISIDQRKLGDEAIETVNARELHGFLESRQQFADWIKGRIEQYGFVEGRDFTVHKFMNGRSSQTDYHVSLGMAKELAMVERNDKGKQARQYFIECERAAKAAAPIDVGVPVLQRAQALDIAANVADRICARFPSLGEPAQQVIFAKIVNPIAGDDVIPLPRMESKTFSAGEVGKLLGVSGNKIGRLANEHGLKTSANGVFVLDKSRSSEKQVSSFLYNQTGVDRLREILRPMAEGDLLGGTK